MRINPGDRAKDKITGLIGIVVCRTTWLYGCIRITIQPEETKDGKVLDSYTIDEQQADILQKQVIIDDETHPSRVDTNNKRNKKAPAGDRPGPGTWKDPTR